MNTQLPVIFSSLVILGCCYPLTIILIINYYFLFNRLLKLDIGYITFFVIVVFVIAVVAVVKRNLKGKIFLIEQFHGIEVGGSTGSRSRPNEKDEFGRRIFIAYLRLSLIN